MIVSSDYDFEEFANALVMLKNSTPSEAKEFAFDEGNVASKICEENTLKYRVSKRPRRSYEQSIAKMYSSDSNDSHQEVKPPTNRSKASNKSKLSVVVVHSTGSSRDEEDASSLDKNQQAKLIRGHYRCGRCGQQKTNHICSMLNDYSSYCSVSTQIEPLFTNISHMRTITVRPKSIAPPYNSSLLGSPLSSPSEFTMH